MFCINCSHPSTKVANSRPNKKTPSIWRRRACPHCHAVYTTYERPSLADNAPVLLGDNKRDTFNLGRLVQSVAASFSHDLHKARYDSLALALTIEDKLTISREPLTPALIAKTTYETLRRFDELAAVQYAARHHLIATIRRRGRPSLASPDL